MSAIADARVAGQPRRRLADDLRAAIAAREIGLRFQPQVAIDGGRVTGVEVLARWHHARLGELGAERLFEAADRAKLLPMLSRHIHRIALEQVADWPVALGELGVAINVTAADLADPGFAADLLAQVGALRIDPVRLTVEITEREPIADLPAAALVLAELRAAGVRVALDDFGSGHAGIAWLRALPVDYLKIDGSLSQDILGDRHDAAIVRHVIAMARERGLGVIVEGVETERHRDALAAAGATHYQGFLCAEPIEAVALAALVEERRRA